VTSITRKTKKKVDEKLVKINKDKCKALYLGQNNPIEQYKPM